LPKDLLLEIGCEELPAGYIPPALRALGRIAGESLQMLRLSHGAAHLWGTPRRLTIMMEDVAEEQAEQEERVLGPPVRTAFDEQGRPTRAAQGFARGQGVEVAQLQEVDTPRGRYVMVEKRRPGQKAAEVLAQEIPRWIQDIYFPKSMRWKDLTLRFARPIHWLVCLLGKDLLTFNLESITSGRTTRGHRFLSPQEVKVSEPRSYKTLCERLYVVVDPEERRARIQEEARRAAADLSGRLLEDSELLETIVYLVEYPVAVAGSFDRDFLELPREVLITAMREHQKFFGVEGQNGQLLPHFVNIANLSSASMDLIREGNERVLRARLSDARFFFEEDRRRPLEGRLEDLRGVVFHAELGTSFEKVQRIRGLAARLVEEIGRQADLAAKVDRAALLCKADLTTEMVGEFPSLQGITGREYALLEGEDPDVAQAIHEHYLPAFSGDRLPSSPVGAIVGLADKLDTITGCFGVGEIPSGAGDPLGLRRAALGVLNILLERGYETPLDWMVDQALDGLHRLLHRPPESVKAEVLEFFRVRLANLWASQGRNGEAVEAVLASGFMNLPDARRRLEALETFMAEEGFEDLAVSSKRVLNIVRAAEPTPVDPGLFQQKEENDLLAVVQEAERQADACMTQGKPLVVLRTLAELRPRIDAFFDAVMVNVEDQRVRQNRLSMLARLARVFTRLADFAKITTKH
jgi:glycyl-tRNA synthetase beta chain